jgi:hypothetical protein
MGAASSRDAPSPAARSKWRLPGRPHCPRRSPFRFVRRARISTLTASGLRGRSRFRRPTPAGKPVRRNASSRPPQTMPGRRSARRHPAAARARQCCQRLPAGINGSDRPTRRTPRDGESKDRVPLLRSRPPSAERQASRPVHRARSSKGQARPSSPRRALCDRTRGPRLVVRQNRCPAMSEPHSRSISPAFGRSRYVAGVFSLLCSGRRK